jgi:hypothetical protein
MIIVNKEDFNTHFYKILLKTLEGTKPWLHRLFFVTYNTYLFLSDLNQMDEVGFSIVNKASRRFTVRGPQDSDWVVRNDYDDEEEEFALVKSIDNSPYTSKQLALACACFFICGVSVVLRFLLTC